MRPLILEFKESPNAVIADYSLIEYDNVLNLNVIKETKKPAIDFVNLETETFTKTQGEGSDSDKNAFSILMDTETSTFVKAEDSDSDNDEPWPNGPIRDLLDTTTITETSETTDQDK